MREPIRVLHVDDQADFADLTATALEREDDRLSVEAMTSGDEVLERLTDGIDCVVSDYDMPGRNGIEVLEAIRERYPDLPFILFTGKGSEEVASEAISAGVTDYLEKEGGLSQYTVLANRIRNAVDQYRSKRALEDSQRRLSLFVEQSPLGVVEWDEEFRIVSLNDAAEEILGYAESEVRGDSWERIVSSTDADAVGEVVDALLENRGGYRSVNENVRADGEVIVCEWYNRVVTDGDSEGSEIPRETGEAGDSVAHGSTNDGVTVTVGDLPDGFYVADDGPGIPEADRDRVFDAGYTTSQDGTGFGLRIVEQVVEAHAWDIEVMEGDEGGARFEITGVEFDA
jgi:PAS domain S-box-containing protein